MTTISNSIPGIALQMNRSCYRNVCLLEDICRAVSSCGRGVMSDLSSPFARRFNAALIDFERPLTKSHSIFTPIHKMPVLNNVVWLFRR
jgi:hypothetical protein